MKKLIVSDIDGTLLKSDKHISERTKARVLQAIDEGHIFAIATGRMHGAGKIITTELDYDGFLISCNGAVVKHLKTGEIISAIQLDDALVKAVAEVCDRYGAYYHLYDVENIYASGNQHLAQKYAEGMAKLPEHLKFGVAFPDDIMDLIGKVPVYKVGLYHEDPDQFHAIMEALKGIDGLQTCKSLDTSFEIGRAHV